VTGTNACYMRNNICTRGWLDEYTYRHQHTHRNGNSNLGYVGARIRRVK